MNDLVKKLRKMHASGFATPGEAADHIETLEAKLERMRGLPSELLRDVAGILITAPTTEREDRPTVPLHYLREVATYVDKCRRASIKMRRAVDELRAALTEDQS